MEKSNIAAENGGVRNQITTPVSQKPANNKPSYFRIVIIIYSLSGMNLNTSFAPTLSPQRRTSFSAG